MKRSKHQYVEIKLETGLKGRGKICLKIKTGKYRVNIRKRLMHIAKKTTTKENNI